MGRRTRAAFALVSLAMGACGAGAPPDPPAELPCDVDRVLVSVCQQCHASPPRNQAPFPLVTYTDTQMVVTGQPLWTYMLAALKAGRMPLPPALLSDDDRGVLVRWLEASAPARGPDDVCTPPPPPPPPPPPDGGS
jgi:hypothetical protein